MIELDVFRELLGPTGVLSAEETAERPEHFRRQTIPRSALGLVRPRTTEELSAVLRICHAAGQPVCVQGGTTGLDGAVSTSGELALSLERMNAIETIDRVNRIAVVQAGCILQTFQEAVAAEGAYYGVDYGGRGSATIGGNIATNAGGMTVLRYGMTREQVLGLEVVLADGTIVSSMNKMLKNNAGYDLKQLFIGTEGTLGVVTRAVLRLRPQTSSVNSALLAFEGFAQVEQFLRLCQDRFGETLTSFEVMWQEHYDHVIAFSGRRAPLRTGHAFYANIEVRGTDQDRDTDHFETVLGGALEAGMVVDAVIPKSKAAIAEVWSPREDMTWANSHYADFAVGDISLPIGDMDVYIAGISQAMKARWPESGLYAFGHIADGNVHVLAVPGNRDPERMEECLGLIYEPLEAIGGSIAAEHGIGKQKVRFLHKSRGPAEIELMRGLKRMFDPKCILNPGRVVAAQAS
jgi:FAD/FMN-containing dehydrogenase